MCEYQPWNVVERKVLVPTKFQNKCEKLMICLFCLTLFCLSREVFNSTCLPSGNLVDGLPLDLHSRKVIRMQEGFDSYQARAYLYIFLPCDPAGKINSLYNEEVFHSRSKFLCMNKMCVSIQSGDS